MVTPLNMMGSNTFRGLTVSETKPISNPATQIYTTDLNEPVSESTENNRPVRSWWWKVRSALGLLPKREATDKDLRLALRAQDADEVMRLLEAGVTPSRYPETAWLCLAARRENKAMMDLLIIYGAEVDQVDNESRGARGRTALHEAAKRGWLKGARLLLEAHANPNLVDGYGQTPLVLAVRRGHEPMVRLLLESGADPHGSSGSLCLLHEATTPGMVDLLVSSGVDVNAPNEAGLPPLHQQAKMGRADVIRQLLFHRANVAAVDRGGRTAAFWLGRGQAQQSLVALVSAGLNLEQVDLEGNVAAHVWPLRSRDHGFLSEGYTRAPAAWTVKNKQGETPLFVLSRTDKAGLADKFMGSVRVACWFPPQPLEKKQETR